MTKSTDLEAAWYGAVNKGTVSKGTGLESAWYGVGWRGVAVLWRGEGLPFGLPAKTQTQLHQTGLPFPG